MSNVIQLPVIAGIEIPVDEHGRFSLNALHKASGGAKKDGPSYWLGLESSKKLINELNKQTTVISVVSTEGRSGGTYAHEILAVEYAGWISAKFRILVNQTFIAYRRGELPPIEPKQESLTPVAKEFRAGLSLAKMMGLKGNQAVLTANKVIRKRTGTDCLELMGMTHLIADQQQVLLTATDVGERIGLSSRKVNPLLEQLGLQKSFRDHKERLVWELLPDGEKFGIYQDTGKKHSDGTPVRQIKWNANVVKFVQEQQGSMA